MLQCDHSILFYATLRVLRAADGRKDACFLYIAKSYLFSFIPQLLKGLKKWKEESVTRGMHYSALS